MSELRKFLRYEISGILLILYTLFLIFCSYDIADQAKILFFLLHNSGSLAQVTIVFALPIGWLLYQIYDSILELSGKDPHKCWREAEYLWKKETARQLSIDQYKALVDYILIDDIYENYPGLADTIRGIWDHYYARCIVFWTSIISIFFAFIMSHYLRFIELMPGVYSWYSFLMASGLLGFVNYLCIFKHKDHIRELVRTQECMLIHKNQKKLKEIKCETELMDRCFDP